jgi:uncharacterized protein (DUF2236 family)
MRKWIDLVEHHLVGVKRYSDEQKREFNAKIKAAQKKIEDEEQREIYVPIEVQQVPSPDDREEWNRYWASMDIKYNKIRREQELLKQKEREAAEREEQAKIDGIRLAAKDAMDDMIEQDRELVSKLAKQGVSSGRKNQQRVKKMAQRQLKK